MYRNSRPVDTVFSGGELLYFRLFSDWVEAGRFAESQIPCPDQSVNRTQHGARPWYVLIPEPTPNVPESPEELNRRRRTIHMGLVRMQAADVPRDYEERGNTYQFVLEHDPLDHNYHHCEIRIYRNGHRLSKNELRKATAAKKHYRHEMSLAAKMILSPAIATGKSKP
jgi:hypothetical protein